VKSRRHSVRRHSTAIGISGRSMQRILHKDLNFHPYKIVIIQELNDRNMANHRISSEQLLKIRNDDGVINTLLMTDEAHFHLSGYVNKQNYPYWAPENPQKLHQRPLHSERLTVWCGIISFGVLGPYFFEDNKGAAVTATSKHYQSYVIVGSISQQYGFSKMEQQPHSKGINECSVGNVSTTHHFLWQRCFMASMFT